MPVDEAFSDAAGTPSPAVAAAVAARVVASQLPRGWVKVLTLTGGPGGGKSSALVTLADRLRGLGIQVFTIPEQATLFHQSGVKFPVDQSVDVQMTWEAARIRSQMAIEDAYKAFARKSGRPTVIICDRGTMDGLAYHTSEEWQQLLEAEGWTNTILRDRYDAVVHMLTAAIGAEQFYTRANNEARRETLQEARDIDKRTRQAWLGHPHFKIVDNHHQDFSNKVREVGTYFLSKLNLPAMPIAMHRYKFVVRAAARPGSRANELGGDITKALPCRSEVVELTSTFLSKSVDPSAAYASSETPSMMDSAKFRVRPFPPPLPLQRGPPAPPLPTVLPKLAAGVRSGANGEAAIDEGGSVRHDVFTDKPETDKAVTDTVIRRRGQGDVFTYYLTVRSFIGGRVGGTWTAPDGQFVTGDADAGQWVVKEQPISEKVYRTLFLHADPSLKTVRRVRHCFVYDQRYYELEPVEDESDTGILIVEADLDSVVGESASVDGNGKKQVVLAHTDHARSIVPPFFQVVKDVTDQKALLYAARQDIRTQRNKP